MSTTITLPAADLAMYLIGPGLLALALAIRYRSEPLFTVQRNVNLDAQALPVKEAERGDFFLISVPEFEDDAIAQLQGVLDNLVPNAVAINRPVESVTEQDIDEWQG